LLSIYELLLEVIKQGPTKGWFLLLNMQVGTRKANLCVGKAGMEQMLP